jgi:trans-aconitate methyltransferase
VANYYGHPWLYQLTFAGTPLGWLRMAGIDTILRECSVLNPQPKSGLEIGCGTGDLAWRLIMAIPTLYLYATDISPAMIRYAALRYRSRRLDFAVEDFWKLTGEYDLVVSMGAWVLFPLHESVIRLRKLIAPGGSAILLTTRPTTFSLIHRRIVHQATGTVLNLHEPHQFASQFRAMGFTVRYRSVSTLEGSYVLTGKVP